MKHSHSTLFLMELIIAILFFSLASTICIQLFAKAHLLSKKTVNENYAVTQSQNLAEIFRATEGNLSEMSKLLSNAQISDNTLTLYFTSDWASCTEADAGYVATLKSSITVDNFQKAEIDVSHYNSTEEKNIYSLTVIHHIKERRGNLE